jgi:transposase InsO family protein
MDGGQYGGFRGGSSSSGGHGIAGPSGRRRPAVLSDGCLGYTCGSCPSTAAARSRLGFFSQKLSPAETRYSTFDRELLAIYSSILHFRHLLEGRSFIIFTDHLPLVGAIGHVSDPCSDRQRRQLSFIAEFLTEILHISGPSNVVADALSRPAQDPAADGCRRVEVQPVVAGRWGPPSGPLAGSTPVVAAAWLRHHPGFSSSSAVGELPSCAAAAAPPSAPAGVAAGSEAAEPPVDVRDIAAVQPACADCQRAASSPSLPVLEVDMSGHCLLVEVSSGVMRPLVPQRFRRAIFQAVHGLAHAGIRATRRMIASRFLWPNLAKDVADWCRSCQACQRAKVKAAAAVQPIAVPMLRFSHVHIDIVGPLPCSQDGFSYVLTTVDRSTRWAEALPLKGIAAADCAEVFIAVWVARYGVPSVVTSDRGVQFTSAFWAATMARLGVKHKLTTAFHPQANGAVERFHRRLKDSLRARLASNDWPQHLPWVMLCLRAAPREDSGLSRQSWCLGRRCCFLAL